MTVYGPPVNRTPLWQPVTDAARTGDVVLPVCNLCQTVQYPPREICQECLSHELSWKIIDAVGELISFTDLHASSELFFRAHLPWVIGLVKLDCGIIVYAHVCDALTETGQRIQLLNRQDKSGQAVFLAVPEGEDEQYALKQYSALLL